MGNQMRLSDREILAFQLFTKLLTAALETTTTGETVLDAMKVTARLSFEAADVFLAEVEHKRNMVNLEEQKP